MIRRSYITTCQFLNDGTPPQQILWFDAARPDKVLPFPSAISSLDYCENPWQAGDLGEVYNTPRTYSNQRAVSGLTYKHPFGTADQFLNGDKSVDPATPIKFNGIIPQPCYDLVENPTPEFAFGTNDSFDVLGPCFSNCSAQFLDLINSQGSLFTKIPQSPSFPAQVWGQLIECTYQFAIQPTWNGVYQWNVDGYFGAVELLIQLTESQTCIAALVSMFSNTPLPEYSQQWEGSQAADTSISFTCTPLAVCVNTAKVGVYYASGAAPSQGTAGWYASVQNPPPENACSGGSGGSGGNQPCPTTGTVLIQVTATTGNPQLDGEYPAVWDAGVRGFVYNGSIVIGTASFLKLNYFCSSPTTVSVSGAVSLPGGAFGPPFHGTVTGQTVPMSMLGSVIVTGSTVAGEYQISVT